MIITPRKSKLYIAFLLLAIVGITGTVGYMLIEDMSVLNSLYMTVITIATVGFKEIHPLSDAGKIFTIFLILTSMGTFLYAVSVITTSIVEGEFRNYFMDFRANSEIKKMKNHVIVCGYGRNGKQAAQDLHAHKHPYVVIEQKREIIAEASAEGNKYFIEGDATLDEVLVRAGIHEAKALICTLPIDADNLYIVLSAKALNQNLNIITRAASDSSEPKLRIAGANNIVMPDKVGGSHMASLVINPDVIEFMEHISIYETANANLEEIICNSIHPDLVEKSINELNIRGFSGANIIGFKSPSGEYIVNPSPDTVVSKGSKLFVLGTPEQIFKMKEIFKKGC